MCTCIGNLTPPLLLIDKPNKDSKAILLFDIEFPSKFLYYEKPQTLFSEQRCCVNQGRERVKCFCVGWEQEPATNRQIWCGIALCLMTLF